MPAAIWLPTEDRLNLQDFHSLPPKLRGLETRTMYISPDKQVFDLTGPYAGRQGVRMANTLAGEHIWPFELVTTTGAYVYGADIERVNINPRMINFGVIIGRHNPPMTNYQFRMAENRWWDSQDENRDGWLGVYTRFSGWRWIKVRPNKASETAQKADPVRFGNNVVQYDMSWIAPSPYYSKPTLYKQWKASDEYKIDPNSGRYFGVLSLANRGDLPTYVKLLVSTGGRAWIQDNHSDRMVEMPRTVGETDGPSYLIDTEPGKRTLTAAKDTVDTLFYKTIRSSKILDFLLDDLGDLGLSMNLRFQSRFIYNVPPRTVLNLRVEHERHNGVITAFLPQRYKRSR